MELNAEEMQQIVDAVGGRLYRRPGKTCNIDRTVIEAMATATDAWIIANQASLIAALPAAWRDNTTAVEKTIGFCIVAAVRAGINVGP